MSQKQFLILIGAGIFCALLFAAPGLYRVSKEYTMDKTRKTVDEPERKTPHTAAVRDNSSDMAPSLTKYQELKLEQVRERSVRGDALAQYELGRRYDAGVGVDEDDIESMKWYLSSAKLGVPEAQFAVGAAYSLGWLESKDGKQEALRWYQLAASQGNIEAQAIIAQYYLDGNGVAKNEEEAKKWFRKAAENGHAESAFKLAELLLAHAEPGKISREVEEALIWLRKAADLGNAEAQLNMGYMALAGGYVPQDLGAAASWWKKSAANGNTEAKNFISEEFYASQQKGPYSKQELVMLYIKATEQGDAQAEWEISRAYADGSTLKENKLESAQWLRKAAGKGHLVAQCNLADAYLSGEGVEKNPAMAFELFQKAANRGDNYAQIKLASFYQNGLVCKTDLTEALKWATIASLAEENQQSLSTVMWLRSGLPKLKNRMTPEQIKAAETLARDWHSAVKGNR